MKKLKLLTALLLTFLIVVGQNAFIAVSAVDYSQNIELMQSLSIYPADVNANALVTRGELASILVNLLRLNSENKGTETVFSDVPQNHTRAEAIRIVNQLKIMVGNGLGEFMPNGEVTTEQISKVMILILGYPEQAGSYLSLAGSEGLFKNVSFSGSAVTYGELARIIENTLNTNLLNVVYSGASNTYNKNSQARNTILGQYLKTERYRVDVVSVDENSSIIRIKIVSASNTEGILNYQAGDTVSVRNRNIKNPSVIQGRRVDLWISEDEYAIYFRERADDSVFYTYITAVNKDIEQNKYYGNYISEIEFNKKNYRLSDNYTVTYNGADAMTASNIFTKRPARIVLEADRVVSIEAYDPKEGGIITNITEKRLFYTYSSGDSKYLDDMSYYSNKYVIIDNMPASYSDLESEMIMDYVILNSETIYIFASTYVIYDTLTAVSDDALFIGDAEYYLSEVYTTAYSNKSGVFTGSESPKDLSGKNVKVYLDQLGEIRFVQLDMRYEYIENTEFYGALSGVKHKDGSIENPQIKIFKITNNKSEELILTLADKVKMPPMVDFRATAEKRNADCIWLFRTNSKGEVREIIKPETEKAVSRFKIGRVYVDGTRKAFAFDYDGSYSGRRLGHIPVGNASYVGLVEYTDGFKAVTAPLGEFGGEIFGEGVSCATYKNPMETDIELIVFWHETKPHSFFVSYEATPAIVKRITETIDNNGEPIYKMTIWLEGGAVDTKFITEDMRRLLKDDCLISYRLRVMYSEIGFVLSGSGDSFGGGTGPGEEANYLIKDLADPAMYAAAIDACTEIDSNREISSSKVILYKGTIYKKSGNTIWLGDNDKYAFQISSQCNSLKLVSGIERSSINDLQSGDTVYFYINHRGDIDYTITLAP